MAQRVEHRLPIARILAPRSIAIIGATEDKGKFGGRVLFHLLKHGYEGRLVPVNPNRATVFDIPAVPSIGQAGNVDVATIAVPPEHVVGVVEDCANAGVGACVIITAQMAESGEEGAARQRAIVDIARLSGMRLIGPNCLGFVNAHLRLALTASFAMGVDRLPAGPLGIVSQSGALMATMFNAAYDAGLGFSTLVSVGNQSDMTENEVVAALIEDEQTRAIALYLEGISDALELFRLAKQARAAHKAVVAVKAGRTAAGQAAAFSHTASLSGPYRLFATAAEASGLVLCDDTEAAALVAGALARWPHGIGPSAGIAVVSGSGGGGGVLADRLSDAGLPLAQPGLETIDRMKDFVAEGHALVPLDAGALKQNGGLAALAKALRLLLDDPATGALAYLMTTQPHMAETADLLFNLESETGKPILLILSAGSVADELRLNLRDRGRFHCNTIDTGSRVLKALRQHAAYRPDPSSETARPLSPALAAMVEDLQPGPVDYSTLATLAGAHAGIAVADAETCLDEAAAVAAAARLGFPVVAKALGPDIVHKSDEGGVLLALADAHAVRAAFATLLARFGNRLSGVLVQKQVQGVAELIVGTLHDPDYGPFVMVGAGGIYAELLSDTITAPAPVSVAEARRMIERLAVSKILKGARGKPRADIDAAAQAVASLSQLATTLGAKLPELEINPLIVGREGQGSFAADIRARAS